MPAIGFAAGMERIIEKIKETQVEIPEIKGAQVYMVQIGEKAQKKCLPLMVELEKEGIETAFILGKESLKGQLRLASKAGAHYALIMGQREVFDKSIILRNMEDSSQETVKLNKLVEVLKEKLEK